MDSLGTMEVDSESGIQQTLKRWFEENSSWRGDNDYRLYNLIGYLIASKLVCICGDIPTSVYQEILASVYQDIKGKRLDQLNELLRKRVLEATHIPIDSFRDEEKLNNVIDSLYYSKKTRVKNKIRCILLLFNLLTLNETGDSRARFRFDLYCPKPVRVIEHINPQSGSCSSGRTMVEQETLNKYLRDNDSLYQSYGLAMADDRVSAAEVLKQRFGQFTEYNLPLTDQVSTELCKRDKPDHQNDHISNLVLLDDRLNSLHEFTNSEFLVKQQYIIGQMYQNKLILPCTVKVFLNCYNDANDVDDSHTTWTDDDRNQYIHGKEGLIPTLMRFVGGDCM